MVFYFIYKMVRNRDDLHAFSFFTLFIYTIFAQVGYAYFPEASILLGAYFGPELFYKYWLFISLSFLLTYAVYRLFYKKSLWANWISIEPHQGYRKYIFYTSAICIFSVLFSYFILNRNQFAWGTANPMGSQWFAIGYRVFSIYCIILFALWRTSKSNGKKSNLPFLLFFTFSLFYIIVATAAGTRSDILYLFISISIYELSPIANAIKTKKKKISIVLMSAFILINFLFLLSKVREQSTISFESLTSSEPSQSNETTNAPMIKVLMQDYYSPSHTLFISMNYGVIDFIEVLKSNFSNSLIMLKHPYLTETITSIVDFRTERGVGWSYYYFVEGYNAFGWLGIIYNAFAFNLALIMFLSLTKTNNKEYNRLMLSIIFLFIVNSMRSQTSDFIKTFWMLLIPGFFASAFAFNFKAIFKIKLI